MQRERQPGQGPGGHVTLGPPPGTQTCRLMLSRVHEHPDGSPPQDSAELSCVLSLTPQWPLTTSW